MPPGSGPGPGVISTETILRVDCFHIRSSSALVIGILGVSVRTSERVVTLLQVAAGAEQPARRQRGHLLEVAARAAVRRVAADADGFDRRGHETDEMHVASRATDRR